MEIRESKVSYRDAKYTLQKYKIISVLNLLKMSKDCCYGDGLNKLFLSCDAPCSNSAEGHVLWGIKKKYLEHIRAGKYRLTATKFRFNND